MNKKIEITPFLTPEEKRENREKLKKDPIGFLLLPTARYIWQKPMHAFGSFFLWFFLVYALMTGLQALNYNMLYCNSSMQEFNGNIMDVYNPFVQEMNRRIEIYNEHQLDPFNPNKTIIGLSMNETIDCNYNLKKFWEGNKTMLETMYTIGVEKWYKNTK